MVMEFTAPRISQKIVLIFACMDTSLDQTLCNERLNVGGYLIEIKYI